MFKELLKLWPYVILIAFLFLAREVIRNNGERARLIDQKEQLVRVNENTLARLAQVKREKGELQLALQAAKDLGGTLVGGTKIILKQDTVYLPPRPVPTDTLPNRARRATGREEFATASVTYDVLAPDKGAIEVGIGFIPKPFNPEVGLVKRGNEYYWTISWAGQTATPTSSFFHLPSRSLLTFNAGGYIRAPDITGAPYMGVDIRQGEAGTASINVGMPIPELKPYIEVGYKKRLGGLF